VPPGAEGPRDYKPWLPAIGLGIVLILLIVFFFLRSDGDDDPAASTTTVSSTTSTSTSTTSTSTTTPTTAPTTAPPTTAPPTTAPPTTAPPTTAAPTTTAPVDPADAALIRACGSGDDFACYEVGRLGLAPPSTISNPQSWANRSDDEVATACQADRNLTACYVAGVRGITLGD
jgi:hypothetical protein